VVYHKSKVNGEYISLAKATNGDNIAEIIIGYLQDISIE